MPFDETPIEERFASVSPDGKVRSRGQRLFVLVGGKARLATAEDLKLHRPLYTTHLETCFSAGGKYE